MYARRGDAGGGYSLSVRRANAARYGRNRRGGIDRHAECTHHLQLPRMRPDLGWGTVESQAVSKFNGQTMERRTYKGLDTQARLLPFTSQAFRTRLNSRSGENDKRYRRHHPASPPTGKLAGTYPLNSKHSNSALMRGIRLQLRCNPDSRRNVRTHFFHRICNLARPMETPLCKISF